MCEVKKLNVKLEKMKKLVIFAVMLLGVATAAFGENENGNVVANVENYNINTSATSLVRFLNTSEDQTPTVIEFQRNFENALKIASVLKEDSRKKVVDNAIKGNLRNMKYILTREQYVRYNRVLQVTLINRQIVH